MNIRLSTRTLALPILLPMVALLAAPSPVLAADYQVVVNASNPRSNMTRDQLGKIFLKRIVKWDNDVPIVPVDQPAAAKVRVLFTRIVHRKPESAIASYWQQQIFSGRAVPPVEKPNDAAVIAFVKSEEGAIGYVSEGASTEGVKVLRID